MANMRKKVEEGAPIIRGWIKFCKDMYNGMAVNNDGRTPYETIRGKKWGESPPQFGEQVMYRKEDENKLEANYQRGTFVGYSTMANEKLIIDKDGVWRSRSIKALPEEEKWSYEAVSKITALPWDTRATSAWVRKPVVDKEFLPGEPIQEEKEERKGKIPLDPVLL